jgi:hypothetical protein
MGAELVVSAKEAVGTEERLALVSIELGPRERDAAAGAVVRG